MLSWLYFSSKNVMNAFSWMPFLERPEGGGCRKPIYGNFEISCDFAVVQLTVTALDRNFILEADDDSHPQELYIVKFLYNLKEIVSILIYFKISFISVIKAEFSASLLQSSVHDPRYILIYYQYWKQLCCLFFYYRFLYYWNMWYFFVVHW